LVTWLRVAQSLIFYFSVLWIVSFHLWLLITLLVSSTFLPYILIFSWYLQDTSIHHSCKNDGRRNT